MKPKALALIRPLHRFAKYLERLRGAGCVAVDFRYRIEPPPLHGMAWSCTAWYPDEDGAVDVKKWGPTGEAALASVVREVTKCRP